MPWVYDEKLKKTVFKKDESNYTPAGTKSKKVEVDDEWNAQVAQDRAAAAAYDAKVIKNNVPAASQSFYNNRYTMGGSAAINNSGIVPKFETYGKYAPIISENLAAGIDYLGFTDEELAEYQKDMLAYGQEALWNQQAATARTGGLDTIDMTGMPKAQKQELQNMGNLSQTDYVYAALSQPAAETQKPNIGKMFDDQNLYEQFIASGASMPGAEQKNLFGETVTNDDQLSVLLGERKTYDDYLKMYSAYPSQALRKDLMNIQSYNTERNVYNVTPDQYEASRARAYAATGTDYDSIARKSGGTDNKWMLDALGKYEEGEKYLAENVFGEVSDDDWYRYHDAYMRKMESSSRTGNQLDAWEEEGKRQTKAQLNAPDGIDHYRPAPMYLNIDPTYLEGYREYQNEDGTYMPAEEYRENAINEWLMAYVDAGNNEAKIKALDKVRGEYLPELEGYNLDKLRYLKPDQKKAIFTAFNNGDVETAKNLIQTYDPILNYQRSGDEIKAWEKKYNEANIGQKVGMNVQSVGQNVGTALEGVKQAIWSVAAPEELEKITAYDPVYDKTRKSNKTRELTGGEIAQATEGVNIPFTDRNLAEAIYHGVMSGADSFAIGNLFAIFGPAAQAIAMGGISYANERMGKLEAGYSNEDANMDAWVQAFIEGVTEYIPFDIMSRNSPKAWRKALGGIYAGGAGEGVSDLGGALYDELKYGEYRDQLLVEGNRGSEAYLWWKWLKYELPNAAAATVGGLIGEAPQQTVSASRDNRQNKQFGENIRNNDSFEFLADLADGAEVSNTAKGIVERMRGEIADKKKGERGDNAVSDKAGVTKADAAKEAKETEQAARDKAERTEDGKTTEEQTAGVTKEDAEAAAREAEQTARDKEERAADGKETAQEDSAGVTKEDAEAMKRKADEIARDVSENADKGKGDKTGEAVKEGGVTKADADAAVKEIEQTARDKGKRGKEGKRSKPVSNAEIGYVYREVMKSLDSAAQNVVAEAFSRDVLETELAKAGFRGDMRKAGNIVEKFINGKTNKAVMEAIKGNEAMRKVALDFVGSIEFEKAVYRNMAGELAYRASKDYVKPESTKADKGAQEATKGVDGRAIVTADDVKISDTPESTVDGNAVTISGVKSIDSDGNVTYEVTDADGNVTEVSENDVSFGQNDAGIVVVAENAKALGANGQTMIKMYRSGQDAVQYSATFSNIAQYAEDGWSADAVNKYGTENGLSADQIQAAYGVGKSRRDYTGAKFQRKNVSGISVGKVDVSGISMAGLNMHQRATVNTMGRIAQVAGFNVKFVQSKADADGKYTTENGSWDPDTLTLTLDIHAGSNSESDTNYAMMHTAGHELTHYIRQFADAGLWSQYQDFVIGHLSDKAFDIDTEINNRIAAARKKGIDMNRDGAIEEIIADASGEALMNITEADIQTLAETNPGLLNKIKAFFKKWISDLKKLVNTAYKGTEAKTKAAKEMQDVVDDMSKKWNELFVNAAKNRADSNVASETTNPNVTVSESGNTAYVDSDSLYSLRTFNESDYVTERAKAAAALAKQMGISQEKAESYIDDVTSIAAMVAKDRDRLDFEAENEYSALKHNSEYKFTVDFSTLCKKRLLYTGTFDAIQKQMPDTALTEDDYISLRQMMADRGYEVACAFCYVESRRKNNGEIINKFLDVYKEAQNTGGQMELGPSNRRKSFKIEDGFTPNIADFNTSEGIANIMHNHRGVYDAYMYFMNARGVSKPKLIESRTEYTREILDKFRSKSAVKAMNKRGGLRLQSFSGFEVVNMLDMMQVVMDMSRVGLMSQAYTKVPAFARVFGGTGVKINLSLVTKGVDKNGKLIFDDIEGMPHEEAFKIRDMYSENVGTILVGKDDATIRAAMADPRIDFIIPYHASGWSTENQNALGIGGYTNFTAGQNETNAATGKGVKNFQPSEYWDYNLTGDENAQIYLEKCREAGRVPKFPQYQNYPGYWKMLIDFKMYDNNGIGSPQRAVRPDFNLSEAKRIMNEYTGGHQNLPVAHDVVNDFVKEYQGNKKYSERYVDDKPVVWVEDNILSDKPAGVKMTDYIVEYLTEHVGEMYTIIESGQHVYIGEEMPEEYVWSEYSKAIRKYNQKLFKAKGRAASGIGEAINIATNRRWEKTKHPHSKDAKYGMYRYDSRIAFPMRDSSGKLTAVKAYNMQLLIRNASDGKKYLYDVVKIKEDTITANSLYERETMGAVKAAQQKGILDSGIITQNSDSDKLQMRDFSNLSDRELLVQALETDLTPEERSHLERYKAKVDDIGKDQHRLDEFNAKIAELRKAGYTAKTSEELRVAETNAKTMRNRIDRKDADLKKIESAAMIQEVVKRNRAEARKSAYALARQRADERQRKAVEHAREVGQKKLDRLKESQAKEKYRKQILDDVKKLHSWIVSPTSKGYVPEFLREPLAEMIEAFDFTSARALKGGEATKADKAFAKALDNMRDAVSRLNKAYAGMDQGAETFIGYVDLPENYAEEFAELVKSMKYGLEKGHSMTGTPFFAMTGEQLHEMSKMLRILKTSISQMNRNLANARYESARMMSEDTMTDMNELTERKKVNKAVEAVNSIFNWKNSTPIMAFQKLGRGGKAVFEAMQNGWDKMAQNSARVIKYAEDTFNAKESNAWSKEVSEIDLDSGKTVQMTVAQKMSLYCLSKREQAKGHLLGGGIRISDIDGKRGTKITQTGNYVLTQNDIDNIIDSLTARQIEVADKLQAFMNTVCARWGNEISMKRFGYEQMTEDNYFPIESDKNNLKKIDETQDGRTSMFRLLNMSSLKPLTPNANNAIVIHDIFDVFADHASNMAKYNAMALPILDFIKWYNYSEKIPVTDASGKPTGQHETKSVRQALERAYGKDADSYLLNFIKDINAEHDGGRNDGIINKFMNLAKAASVGANLRVYALQITSLPRAAYVINSKYLAKGVVAHKEKGAAQENVGILQWKDLGFFSTDIARNTRTMIKQDEGILDKIRGWQMKPAELMDKVTANILYEAVKAEMADLHKNVKPGSDQYKRMVNDRVREIIYKTQVADSTMTRSELMRSKGAWPMFTAFMSESTITVNMLNEGIQEAIYKKRGGTLDENDIKPGTKIYKATMSFIASGMFGAMVAAAFGAFRDDDEYETFKEKYLDALKSSVMDNLNVLSMLPLINEASDAIGAALKGEEYSFDTLAAQSLTSLVGTVKAVSEYAKGNRTFTNMFYNVLKTLSYSSGVGVYNAVRDVFSIYNTFFAPVFGTKKLQNYKTSEKKTAAAMYEAARNGDAALFDEYVSRSAMYGIEAEDLEGEYNKLISDDYLAGDIGEDDALSMLKMYGGKTTYQAQTVLDKLDYQKESGEKFSDIEKNYVSGKISKADAKAALTKYGDTTASDADDKILTWDYEKTTGRKYSSLDNAYIRGEVTRAEIKNAKIKYGGKDSSSAESTILHLDYQKKTGRPWSKLMDDYHAGRFNSTQLKKYFMDYDGKSENEALDLVDKYDWAKTHGGSTDGYSKYVTIHEAIDSGRGFDEAVQKIVDKYTARGKKEKDILSDIRSSITSKYKPIYLAASASEQARMREYLLEVYVALGGNYNTYYKNMTDKWFDD